MTPKLHPSKLPARLAQNVGSARAKPNPSGAVTTSREILNRRDIVGGGGSSESLPVDSPEHTAIAGINLGVTVPGPPNSYMSARIDVFGYVPAIPTDEGMRAALERITAICQERLELEVEEANKAMR